MSLYAALYSGVSGLGAYSSALGMISDNITNINTVGYKETRARFSTLVTETRSANRYSPGGVQVLPQNLISKQGLLQSSSSATDLSIDGAGFFVVRQDTKNNEAVAFTRAGSFTPDAAGFLRNTAGQYLLGFPLDEEGNPPSTRSTEQLVPITISGLTGTAQATTKIDPLRGNLQSSQPVSSDVTGGIYDMTDPTKNMAGNGVAPDFVRNIQVFDSMGTPHNLTFGFLKSAATNEWNVEVWSTDGQNVTPLPGGQIASGTLAFNSDGSLNKVGSSPALLGALNVDWNSASGAAKAANSTIALNWGSNGDVDGFTQFDTNSTLISSSINGARFGNVNGVSISKDGTVTALFDNGLQRQVYQLPIAVFQNPDGLTRRQGNSYSMSDDSGVFTLQVAGDGGSGAVAPSTLEASTVDLAREFSELITVQRGFSASTKVITTADQMLDELNNIKR
ncbi:flagellar hook protein FlgE [Govanella unica]|uniref:Flagellar hook protein FlgE n=1 Tax=Govanella unica TaxID=2975056 RepID=A0A9X3TWH0_9PROT|nr:flagellar hook protein FlgE [Govania unica]MDA5193018.1 flagellar hook protein FlgE [Govania unica]